jgi:hypothetical protein
MEVDRKKQGANRRGWKKVESRKNKYNKEGDVKIQKKKNEQEELVWSHVAKRMWRALRIRAK